MKMTTSRKIITRTLYKEIFEHREKYKMNFLFLVPDRSYTVFRSILNDPTTVPDLKNFLE